MGGATFAHQEAQKDTTCVRITTTASPLQAGGATASGPALGNGYEIILQGFNWESHRHNWYQVVTLGLSALLRQHHVASAGALTEMSQCCSNTIIYFSEVLTLVPLFGCMCADTLRLKAVPRCRR